jgi:hypothetical protein
VDDYGRPFQSDDRRYQAPAAPAAPAVKLRRRAGRVDPHRHVPQESVSDARPTPADVAPDPLPILRAEEGVEFAPARPMQAAQALQTAQALQAPPTVQTVPTVEIMPAVPTAQATQTAVAVGDVVVTAGSVRAEIRIVARARTQWLDPWSSEPDAVLPVVLGEHGLRRFFLDLATVPGVLAVSGALPLCRLYALDIAEKISGHGSRVIVVGDALGNVATPGWQRRASFPEIDPTDPDSGIVIAQRVIGVDLELAHDLARRTGGRYVAVVIDEVRRPRLSVSVEATAA